MRTLHLLFAAAWMTASASPIWAATILSDNLAGLSAGTETATATRWLAASFGTGSEDATLGSVTLLLANPIAGAATIELYTDGDLEPGDWVGTLTSPAEYSSELSEASFTSSGLTLEADSTYWVVLSAASGEFSWSWTSENTGLGDGFQHTWGDSDDAGETWYSYDIFPTQLQVTTVTADGDTDGDGDVDLDDLNNVRNYFGAADPTLGDTDADGDVDLDDLNNVRNTFGVGSATAASVPEPASIAIAVGLLVAGMASIVCGKLS